jgi:hypothetical protein
MGTKSERLAVLPDAEQYALYGLPDFDDGQRSEYLSLSPQEVLLASSRSSLHARVCCVLQIGYFKAKHAFFHFTSFKSRGVIPALFPATSRAARPVLAMALQRRRGARKQPDHQRQAAMQYRPT